MKLSVSIESPDTHWLLMPPRWKAYALLMASGEPVEGLNLSPKDMALAEKYLTPIHPVIDECIQRKARISQVRAQAARSPRKKEAVVIPEPCVTPRPVALACIKPENQASFERVWKHWPKRGDGKPSKGDKAKAQRCFQDIVSAGIATAQELENAAIIYWDHPNVQEGFVRMVATFYSLKDGLWREALERVRTLGHTPGINLFEVIQSEEEKDA